MRPFPASWLPFCLVALVGCGESWTWAVGDGGTDSASLRDRDGDGHVAFEAGGDDCWDDPASIPAGYDSVNGAAQPAAADVHPGAAEVWYDGVDQDCAGGDDFDQDADGHGTATHPNRAGAVGDDCYDAVEDGVPEGGSSCTRTGSPSPADVHPGAEDEPYDGVDADCAGNDDFDQDGDGYGRCAECDDDDASVFPNDEPDAWYDGVDANCDGNDGDQDEDGYYVAGYGWAVPADYQAGDCADDPTDTASALNGLPAVPAEEIHPSAADAWYDGVDADCAGDDDFDQDTDGQRTDVWPDRAGATGEDCVDTDPTIYVGAADAWYDGVDADCAGNDDFDQDGDGYARDLDCDDTDGTVSPGAAEDCATASDDDCSGSTNDADALGCTAFSPDVDGDSYGDLGGAACLCVATSTYSLSGVTDADADCDDADASVNPGAAEVCSDGVDNDCDGGAGGCALVSTSVSGADAVWTGEAEWDAAGYTVADAGDVNADGFDDVVVGAYGNDEAGAEAGSAYLMLGSSAPTSASLAGAIQYTGDVLADGAGMSAAGAGDIDGDGFDDVLLGAPGHRDGTGTIVGAAFLLLGDTTLASGAVSSGVELEGEAGGRQTGISVSAAGDVNGDGFRDIVVGTDTSTEGGYTYLILGTGSPADMNVSTAIAYTGYTWGSTYDYAGRSVSGGGDVDGDGFDDLVIGAPSAYPEPGGAYLELGSHAPTSHRLTTSIKFSGEASYDYAGCAVLLAGDVNADGYADVAIGARYNDDGGTDSGAAYLVMGSASVSSVSLSTAVEYTGADPSDSAGVSLTSAGDLDGDGYEDIVVGAYGNASYAGRAYLIPGSSSPASADLSTMTALSGLNPNDFASFGVAGNLDVNGDGELDLVVGAHGVDDAGSAAGAAYLFLGRGL